MISSPGWIAALVSIVAFGSFGAPIKSEVVQKLNVNPLVYQSYKTFMCFVTSWLVLVFRIEDFSYTPWGIISGLFWVPGGIATIFAIQSVGLAVAIGVGNAFIVLVSFVWGIFVFNESVQSLPAACISILCMMTGIFGMAFFSSSTTTTTITNDDDTEEEESSSNVDYSRIIRSSAGNNNETSNNNNNETLNTTTSNENNFIINNNDSYYQQSPSIIIQDNNDDNDIVVERLLDESSDNNNTNENSIDTNVFITICDHKIHRRTVGIAAAVFNGIWGGSIMVPMHFSNSTTTSGMGYAISFGIGASIITIILWIFLFVYRLYQNRWSFEVAYNSLPSFYIKKMWKQGCASGLLWSIGNFGSMICVQQLGEGVGYSVVQAAMLVSGLWGIFYFKEITNWVVIFKWFLSATLTVGGILLLSYEHEKA